MGARRVRDALAFISSTAEDLAQCRAAVREAAQHAGFYAEMHEYWPARDNPPYAECMARVDGSQVLVVIVAHRYGWEPPDQPIVDKAARKSITWLECERAVDNVAEVLACLLDDEAAWPAELKEDYEVSRALEEHGFRSAEFARVAQETERQTQRLEAFKAWLWERGIRATFADDQDAGRAVERALRLCPNRWACARGRARSCSRRWRIGWIGAAPVGWVARSCAPSWSVARRF
jgi:hypothetical protein